MAVSANKPITTTNELINTLAKSMATSPRTVLYIVGLTHNGLSLIIHKPFKDVATTKIGKRIIQLIAVKELLSKQLGADKYEIVYCLTAPVYRNSKNILFDFSTALQKDTYSREDLFHIAETALKICRGECRVPSSKKKLIPTNLQDAFDKTWEKSKEFLTPLDGDEIALDMIKNKCMSIFMSGVLAYDNSSDEEPKTSFKGRAQKNEISEIYRAWWEKSSTKDPSPQIAFSAGYNIGKIDGIHEVEEKNNGDELV